jgi:biotin transport system substrate-specific component
MNYILPQTQSATIKMLIGTLILFCCAQISIPLQPVPITLQTLGVLCLGLCFERRVAMQAVLFYIALGAVGAPVFAGFKPGAITFFSPTAGYLIGFVAAIYAMTSMNKETLLKQVLASFLGLFLIYFCGVCGLLRYMDFNHAISVGVLPFIIPGCIKSALLIAILRYLKN